MPPHSSHLLQPLDVVPYSLLKRYYSDGISLLARSQVYHINKETFLPAFKAAFEKTFTLENVCAGFRTSSLDEKVKQLSKGAQQIAYKMVVVQEEIGRLEEAVNILTKHKTRKRQYISTEKTLTVGEISNLIAEKEGGRREDGETPAKRVRTQRRCGRCSEFGHNLRTCTVETETADNSNASE
ncbi:DDE superfamily endonuclease [Pyrenophora seminiperda CCB06]|uniref:DDE superfamily endonuclease n=1 Tax=Pyrenophora seminiperda CCB06 TaxID=1302712 RepID=A0A3M7LVV9_9PLEO|nr:DDE superfamily endonuclease [Pyrenophora seminiperda CCB06]